VVSSNAALLALLGGYFAHQRLMGFATPLPSAVPSHQDDWLAWEERKQRRLWKTNGSHRVA
jgi:hypothetical protein